MKMGINTLQKSPLKKGGALFTFSLAVSCGAMLFAPAQANAYESFSDEMMNAVTKGKPYIDMRYRYEYAKQQGTTRNAHASTLSTKVGFESGEFYDTKIGVEVENVAVLSKKAYYNSGENNRTAYPLVPDPDTTEINQLYAEFGQIENTKVKVGRQVITLDNERFVGDDSWRQNDQTFDALAITYTGMQDFKGFYGYIMNINRPLGNQAVDGEWGSDIHLFNVKYEALPLLTPVAYTYLMDINDSPTSSNKTFGGSLSGNVDSFYNSKLNYHAEYAYQSDYANNPISYSATYYNLTGGLDVFGFNFKVGYDVIGADSTAGTSFQFPIGTYHSYNGWSDFEMVAPLAKGLKDISFTAGYDLDLPLRYMDNIKLLSSYHRFKEAKGGGDIGNEIDFQARKDFEYFNLTVKYADFDAVSGTPYNDIQKLWLMMGASF
jgi:hypothetical protein